MLLNSHTDANMQLTVNTFGHFYLTLLTFSWLYWNSWHFPDSFQNPSHFQVFQISGHPVSRNFVSIHLSNNSTINYSLLAYWRLRARFCKVKVNIGCQLTERQLDNKLNSSFRFTNVRHVKSNLSQLTDDQSVTRILIGWITSREICDQSLPW